MSGDHDRADPVSDRHHLLEPVPELRHRAVVLGARRRAGAAPGRWRRPPPPRPPRASRPPRTGRAHGADRGARPPRPAPRRARRSSGSRRPTQRTPSKRLARCRQLGRGEALDPARHEGDAGRLLVAADVPLLRAGVADAGAPEQPAGQRLTVAGHRGGHGHESRRPEGEASSRPRARPSDQVKRSVCGSPPDTVTLSADGWKSASRNRASTSGSPVSRSSGRTAAPWPETISSGGPAGVPVPRERPGHEARAPVREGHGVLGGHHLDAALALVGHGGDRRPPRAPRRAPGPPGLGACERGGDRAPRPATPPPAGAGGGGARRETGNCRPSARGATGRRRRAGGVLPSRAS